MAENSGVRKSGRKARSKSLGPGGLDALLNQEKRGEERTSAAGKPRKRRESMVPASQVKSILLPTVPISPRPHPARAGMSRRRTSLLNLPKLNLPSKSTSSSNPFSIGSDSSNGVTTSIPLRTEEEQAAAARERQRKDILATRAERRKSLGNRRVSFATEATLHTFEPSASLGGTSEGAKAVQPKSSKGKEAKKDDRRDSFPGPELSDSSSDSDEDAFSSSPIADSDELGRLVDPSEQTNISSNSDSGSDSESDYEATINRKKKKAAEAAAAENKGNLFPNITPMEFDEEEEMRKEIAKEKDTKVGGKKGIRNFFKKPITVIRGDQPQDQPSKKPVSNSKKPFEDDGDGEADMDITKAVGGVLNKAPGPSDGGVDVDEQDVDMDITRPIGGLISAVRAVQAKQPQVKPSALFGAGSDDEGDGGADMDITTAVGGLVQPRKPADTEVNYPSLPTFDTEEADMDMTRPVGGLLQSVQYPPLPSFPVEDEDTAMDVDDDETADMDITRAIGRILPPDSKKSAAFANDDQTMDITMAVGGIKDTSASTAKKPKKSAAFASDDQTMDITMAVGGIKHTSSGTTSSDDEAESSDEGELGEKTMDMTTAIGGIINKESPPPARKKGGRRRSSTIGTVLLQSGKDWAREQELERQLQKDAEEQTDESDGDMDETVAVGGIVRQNTAAKGSPKTAKEDLPVQAPSQDDHVGDMSIDDDDEEDEGDEMEFTAIVPSQIVRRGRENTPSPPQPSTKTTRKDNAALIHSLEGPRINNNTPRPENTDEPPKTPKAGPPANASSLAQPPRNFREGSQSLLPSPGGGWIPPLQKHNVPHSISNTPTDAAVKPSITAAAPKSPSLDRNTQGGILEALTQPKHSPQKKRVTRSSTGKGRPSTSSPATVKTTAAPEPPPTTPQPSTRAARSSRGSNATEFVVAALSTPQRLKNAPQPPQDASPETHTTTANSSITSSSIPKSASFETPPRRQTDPADGFTLSARRRILKPTNPSAPLANTPQRRNSGVGIDKLGLGSPHVLASVKRRQSIGQNSPLKSKFDSPKLLLSEGSRFAADQTREQNEKENEAYLTQKRELERAKDESLPLKERIESMTPKKATSKKRTSMEFNTSASTNRSLFGEPNGAAKGTKRRSMGLDKPSVAVTPAQDSDKPSESQGRVTRSRTSLTGTASVSPPPGPVEVTKAVSPPTQSQPEAPEDDDDEEVPRITMQQFLDMTSISFLDNITYTKRRQTFAPGARRAIIPKPSALFKKGAKDGVVEPEQSLDMDEDEDRESKLGDWITAGAATVVVYELFFKSCRELKQYIHAGKTQMAQLEAKINRQNPRLFREYMDNPVDVKLIMDTQFKSIKTHARLRAKKEWYHWRMEQLANINQQLDINFTGLKKDEEVLSKQCEIVNEALPAALKARAEMKRRLEILKERRKELEACDPVELAKARERLVELRKEVEKKRELAIQKKEMVKQLDEGIEERKKKMEKLKEEIDEAERVKEMNRGFSEEEVWALRDSVRAQEQKSGWSIISVEKSIMTMAYQRALLLTIDASSATAANLQLKYAGEGGSHALLIEQQYFFELLQEQVKAISTAREAIKVVSRFWTATEKIVAQIAKIRGQWITTCSFRPAERQEPGEKNLLEISVKVVLPEEKARLLVVFTVDGEALFKQSALTSETLNENHFSDVVEVLAKPIYCSGPRKIKADAANGKIRGGVTGASAMGSGFGWRGIVKDVIGKCFEKQQARKAAPPPQLQASTASTKITPRKTRSNQTPGKKIPVRAATIPTETATSSAAAAAVPAPVQPNRLAKPSAIPTLFDKAAAPFGTGKRGIPVPTKAAHDDRELPR
ncbi:Spc7 kinetochore protein-domain-containing protein [Peziza echinospora]|nr:Spc7 kinetochore protein-domain-containing protein [Peziza echinospora]